jgi:BlaI family penicillinase repressor
MAAPQLSDAEWEVMKVLWAHGPASVNEACEHLHSVTKWHPKTVRTMLIRLEKKRAVGTKTKDGIYHYYSLVSREECTRHATHSFIDRVFDGALAPMVAHFVSGKSLTAEEKRELKKLLSKKT